MREIGTSWDRENRNTINDNFRESKNRVDNLIKNTPQPSEVVDVRVDEEGTIHTTAKERVDAEASKRKAKDDELTAQLAQTETKIENIMFQVGKIIIPEVDDTPRIQRIIDFVSSYGGGTAYLPPGEYHISDQIIIKNNVYLKGAGKYSTVIRPTQTFKVELIAGTKAASFIVSQNYNVAGIGDYASAFNLEISDIAFVFDDTRTALDSDKVASIGLMNAQKVKVHDCYFKGFSQHAVDITASKLVEVYNNLCVGHYWSAIQVDAGGGGIYGGTSDKTQPSLYVNIFNNTIDGNQTSTVGAIQLHKRGGDFVHIYENTIVNSGYGISADSYFDNNWNPISTMGNIEIRNNKIKSTKVNSKGIGLGVKGTNIKITNNNVDVVGTALRLRTTKQYNENCNITDNYFSGSDNLIEGLMNSVAKGNTFRNKDSKMKLNGNRQMMFVANIISDHGVLLQDITLTDPRDNSTVTFTTLTMHFIENHFVNSVGDGITFEIITGSGFREFYFIYNQSFSNTIFSDSFNLAQMSNTDGMIIFDRETLRIRQRSSRPSNPLRGQMIYDSTLNKPIWFNGTSWADATGTTV